MQLCQIVNVGPMLIVVAKSEHAANRGAPVGGRLQIRSASKEIHLIRIGERRGIILRSEWHAILARQTPDPQGVVTREDANRDLVFDSAQGYRQRVIRRAANHAAVLELVFLIAVNWIDEVVREVIVQMQLIVDEKRAGGELPGAQTLMILN